MKEMKLREGVSLLKKCRKQKYRYNIIKGKTGSIILGNIRFEVVAEFIYLGKALKEKNEKMVEIQNTLKIANKS